MKFPLRIVLTLLLAAAVPAGSNAQSGKDSPSLRAQAAAKKEKSAGKKKKKSETATEKKDAKHSKTGKPEPFLDPELEQYAIFEKTAPYPDRTAPVVTRLPLTIEKGARVVFVGNTLFDRAADFGYFESLLHQKYPGHQLVIRNLAWSADEVDIQTRPANFGSLDQHLTVQKADIIFAAFGFNESFAGEKAIPRFREKLASFLKRLKASAFNGKSGPRIVLVSPIANENVEGVPAADLNNARLAAYTRAMQEVAAEQKIGFANVFDATLEALSDPKTDLTFNGVHLEDAGYRVFANALYKKAFAEEVPPAVNENVREMIVEKNRQFFYRYRPVNTFYYTGGRNKKYGYLDFLPAMRNFDIMVANRDRVIWDLARGKPAPAVIDDSNVPPLPETAQSLGANEWLSPDDELAAFNIDPRFEVNCFASEEDFPEIACPIQMRWDARGRLWVSCSTTYPHVYPGQEPNDKIVILEDTDWDGKADKSTVFADDLHIPLSFELGDGGVYVSEEPHFAFIKDTDGDGKADFRRKLSTGYGTEDSHHALHDFVWTPDGDLMFRESIFHTSQVETPYGPVRAMNSSWFRFRPDSQRLIAFGSYHNTNPWGVTYDNWGHHVASHPIFASAFHALNPPYPEQHPRAAGIPAYSGVCGHDFVYTPAFPEELQGGFIKVRYKPTNRVEIHKWIEHDDHFEEEYQGDLIFSTNLSFIPVDARFGPRGAFYICDWYNPIKGHAQYSLRDERRDRKSGRIWRVTAKDMPLQDPPKIAGQPIPALLDILKSPEYRHRYWAKRELRERKPAAVRKALDEWVANLEPEDARFRHHQVEGLWMYRNVGAANTALLEEVIDCDNHHARAAATRQLRYWHPDLPNAIALLRKRANDENGIVRMEAAIAASWIGTAEALDTVLDVLKHPMGDHLKFAVRSALGSENLSRHWKGKDAFLAGHPEVNEFFVAYDKTAKAKIKIGSRSASEADFDSQKDLKTVEISCIPERLLYTLTEFEVAAGQPVKIIFTNPDVTPHNLVIVQPGALEEIGMAGNEMAKDPAGITKHFIPESDKILHHTKLLSQDTGEVLRFKAPEQPGVYPYLCTFPGHWVIMNGKMTVTDPM